MEITHTYLNGSGKVDEARLDLFYKKFIELTDKLELIEELERDKGNSENGMIEGTTEKGEDSE
jgi:hypothetical protein